MRTGLDACAANLRSLLKCWVLLSCNAAVSMPAHPVQFCPTTSKCSMSCCQGHLRLWHPATHALFKRKKRSCESTGRRNSASSTAAAAASTKSVSQPDALDCHHFYSCWRCCFLPTKNRIELQKHRSLTSGRNLKYKRPPLLVQLRVQPRRASECDFL